MRNDIITQVFLFTLLSLVPVVIFAQAPDVRSIRPIVVLAIDSSGSMERKNACVCAIPDACTATECLPTCSAVTGYQKSKWATLAEVMTGTFSGYTCSPQTRSGGVYTGQYDENYFIQHINIGYSSQAADGILDAYRNRARFALMTFDGISTRIGDSMLVSQATFEGAAYIAASIGSAGNYSYGNRRTFTLPGCPTVFEIDNGARNTSATVGALVSVGGITADDGAVTDTIQTNLLAVRPYGATPTAGLLDDVRYYLQNNADVKQVTVSGVGDPYYACRNRYVLLITDGYPNQDMRQDPYNCGGLGGTCPYDTPETIVADLCQYTSTTGSCRGIAKGVFVVGFNVDDATAKPRLDAIAQNGGTSSAYFATDPASLRSALSTVLNQAAPNATSRTVPLFSSSGTSTGQTQSQFSSGFTVGQGSDPWGGILERTRYICSGTEAVAETVSDAAGDRFQVTLNNRVAARTLYTVVPTIAANAAGNIRGVSTGVSSLGIRSDSVFNSSGLSSPGTGGPSCGAGSYTAKTVPTVSETNKSLVAFTSANVTAAMLGVATNTERDDVINYVYANASSPALRQQNKLGDIYHSSPIAVSAPTKDLADESYNLFRQRSEVANRPKIIYVGSNDGILHAFVAEDTTITAGPHAPASLTAGTELWGFVPPAVFSKLSASRTSHQYTVDGTPFVRDVFFRRTPGTAPDAASYHTVLVMGLHDGGNVYFALDVTDPFSPTFLWQYTMTDMGLTYPQPAIAQIMIQGQSGGSSFTGYEERAVALLPGGYATSITDSGGTCNVGATGCLPKGKGFTGAPSGRTRIKCWGTTGRGLSFVDIATGDLVKYFDDQHFNAPLIGGVSVFGAEPGQLNNRAYLTDADGTVWRVNFNGYDPKTWDVTPMYDIFNDSTALAGQPGSYPPVVTTDPAGNVVVLQATGDVDNLSSTAINRVVSLTDNTSYGATGQATGYSTTLNWLMTLSTGEHVTGPLELFDSKLYFGKFNASADPLNECSFGVSYLCGVHYKDASSGTTPQAGFESVVNSGTFDTTCLGPYTNEVLMGVAVTQRPTCYSGLDITDPYLGRRFVVQQSGGGQFYLVGQLSGASVAAPGSGSITALSRQLPTATLPTRVQSWAGTVDQ